MSETEKKRLKEVWKIQVDKETRYINDRIEACETLIKASKTTVDLIFDKKAAVDDEEGTNKKALPQLKKKEKSALKNKRERGEKEKQKDRDSLLRDMVDEERSDQQILQDLLNKKVEE